MAKALLLYLAKVATAAAEFGRPSAALLNRAGMIPQQLAVEARISRPWHDDASPQKWGIQPPEISSWNTTGDAAIIGSSSVLAFRMASVGAAPK
jgi:hypothetical protein